MTLRITARIISGAMLALGLVGTGAFGQTFPAKPVKLIVPYPPGGPIDGYARGLSDALTHKWHQQVIIDNRPGANEIIADQVLTSSAADGYTLILGTDPTFTQNQFLFNKLPFDPTKDIVPVTQVVNVNMVLITRGDLPSNNMREFVNLMKQEAGKGSYGSAGMGNVTHLPFEELMQREGFKMTHVPYKGIAPAAQDMMSGTIDAMFAGSSTAIPQMKSGRMKILAISGNKRAPALPDVPTFAEAGFPGFEARFFMGLGAPKGLSPEIAEKIARDVREVVRNPEFIAKNVDIFGFESVGSSPAEFARYIATERVVAEKRIRTANVKLD